VRSAADQRVEAPARSDVLVKHPDQLLILSHRDDVSPQHAGLFRKRPLDRSTKGRRVRHGPTLRQLIGAHRRVNRVRRNDTGWIRW